MQRDHLCNYSKDFQGYVIVSFNLELIAQGFLDDYTREGFWYNYFGCCYTQNKKLPFKFRGNKLFDLYVENAPEPADVIWDSLNYTESERNVRSWIGSFVVFIAM